MSLPTAAALRSRKLAEIQNTTYDLLIIGGGITGAGIALDASSRGLKTLLIEKNDFASGTSSKSTKLIHGGLRYLKNFEFGLVREVGHERAIVWKNAPHLVHPEKMLLPIVEGGSLSKLGASVGIYLYDYLAGVKASERRKMLSAEETAKTEPFLNKQILKGGALYTEYRTDDARLTVEILKTAERFGATVINYVKAEKPVYQGKKIGGFEIRDELTGDTFSVQASGVINAAGPWVDEIRKADGSLSGKYLKLSKGVHLVFPFKKLPVNQSLYFDVKGDKGRMIFLIPRGRAVYAGTTDTFYDYADNPNVTQEDVCYILDAVNALFPEAKLTENDVESTWSGVRPLIMEEGKSASELSRKDELFVSESGMITIAGGKLTGYRQMARKSVDTFLRNTPELQATCKPCFTETIKLASAGFESKTQFLQTLKDSAGQIPGSLLVLESLFDKYGSETDVILNMAYDIYSENRTLENPLVLAELLYTIQHEWVVKPSDFYNRRTGLLYFNRPKVSETARLIDAHFAEWSGFSPTQWGEFNKQWNHEYNEVLNFQ